MTLEVAIEVCVKAFCMGKSAYHPYAARRFSGLWILEDAPGRKVPRKIEVFTHGLAPDETIARVRESGIGWHFVCEVHPDESDAAEIRAEYKKLGYRAMGTEWFFVHDLEDIPAFDSEPPVRLIPDAEAFARIRQRPRQPRRFRPEARNYAIWDETGDYGWVFSVPYGPDAWVSDLYVYPEHRGKGYGRALMSRLLRDDKAAGIRTSVLVASTSGRRLYPHLGYQQIGVLQVFCPPKR